MTKYYRPTDPGRLIARSEKAATKLHWKPKTRFKQLVRIMVDADMRRIGVQPPGEGDEILRKTFPSRWWSSD